MKLEFKDGKLKRKCPKGMVFDEVKKICVPRTEENDDGIPDEL